jgi:hypothetical protein
MPTFFTLLLLFGLSLFLFKLFAKQFLNFSLEFRIAQLFLLLNLLELKLKVFKNINGLNSYTKNSQRVLLTCNRDGKIFLLSSSLLFDHVVHVISLFRYKTAILFEVFINLKRKC